MVTWHNVYYKLYENQLVEEQKHGDINIQEHIAIWPSRIPISLP